MKIKILFLIVVGQMFSPSCESKGRLAGLSKAVQVYFHKDFALKEAEKSLRETDKALKIEYAAKISEVHHARTMFESACANITAELNPMIRQIGFFKNDESSLKTTTKNMSLHITMFNLAIKEEFYRAKKANFNTSNIQNHYNLREIEEAYESLKVVLKKVSIGNFEKSDMIFFNYFLNKPWYVYVLNQESFKELVFKAVHIVSRILGDPSPEVKPNYISGLILNIGKLDKIGFLHFILSIVPKMTLGDLYDLITKKDDVVWEILNSTEHKEVLLSLDLIKKILDGVDVDASAAGLFRLLGELLTPSLIESITDKSVFQIILAENKARSVAWVKNMFKVTAKFMGGQEFSHDKLVELIWESSKKIPCYDLERLIADLRQEGDRECIALAAKISLLSRVDQPPTFSLPKTSVGLCEYLIGDDSSSSP